MILTNISRNSLVCIAGDSHERGSSVKHEKLMKEIVACSPLSAAAEALATAAEYEGQQYQQAHNCYDYYCPGLQATGMIAAVQWLKIARQCSDC